MGLFATPISNDPTKVEGIVHSVDTVRFVCKVKTSNGQYLDDVIWSTENCGTLQFNDIVLVELGTSYPIIVARLGDHGDPNEYAPNIESPGVDADVGNFSSGSNGTVNHTTKPIDILSGDQVVSNENGGLFGLLRGGTFIARASKLAQLVISRYDDLVRIVARNYEVFTDVMLDISINIRGRAYRFIGYSDTIQNTRDDIYKYQEIFGDTVAGQTLKNNYYGYNTTSFAALPAPNTIIRKYEVNDGMNWLYKQELYTTGQCYQEIRRADGKICTYINHIKDKWEIKSYDESENDPPLPEFGKITVTPDNIVITYSDDEIPIVSVVTMDDTGVNVVVNGGATLNITPGFAELRFGSNYLRVDGTSVTCSNSL